MEAKRELDKEKADHSKGKCFKGNQSHQVEFGAGPTNARSYKGRSGQSVRDGRGGSIRGKNEYDWKVILFLSPRLPTFTKNPTTLQPI
jgi:hypothetical protein